MKSAAGLIRLICSVEEYGAVIPEIECVFWKLAMFCAVGLFALFAKNFVSALKYSDIPAIVAVKYSELPTGLTGLANALNSRMKSCAVTGRAGLEFHCTPGLMWKV